MYCWMWTPPTASREVAASRRTSARTMLRKRGRDGAVADRLDEEEWFESMLRSFRYGLDADRSRSVYVRGQPPTTSRSNCLEQLDAAARQTFPPNGQTTVWRSRYLLRATSRDGPLADAASPLPLAADAPAPCCDESDPAGDQGEQHDAGLGGEERRIERGRAGGLLAHEYCHCRDEPEQRDRRRAHQGGKPPARRLPEEVVDPRRVHTSRTG